MSSPSRILEEGGGTRFPLEGCQRSEPKRLNPGCRNQIRGFWPKRTQGSYLPWNLSVTAKIGPFFRRFKWESCARSRIRSLESFDAPSHASIKQTGEKSQAEGAQLGVGRVWLAKPRQHASGTTDPWAQEAGHGATDQRACSGSNQSKISLCRRRVDPIRARLPSSPSKPATSRPGHIRGPG